MINYIVLGLALLFEGAALTIAIREFNKARGEFEFLDAIRFGKDPSMFVVLFEDGAAMAGLLVALLGVFLTESTGNVVFDGVASIIIGVILGLTAIWLAVETKGLLIGEGANRHVVAKIRAALEGGRDILHVNEIATLHMGPAYIVVTLSADFRDGMMSQAVERSLARLDREIKALNPRIKRVFIEAEAITAHTAAADRLTTGPAWPSRPARRSPRGVFSPPRPTFAEPPRRDRALPAIARSPRCLPRPRRQPCLRRTDRNRQRNTKISQRTEFS